ncbi:hypothetical protein [Clostridium paraputrificum]|uniref:hypothetical protein n=1 Tax=Clostridium paraputrificum TaxID=29363 RepID=UPI00374F1BA0
MTNKIQDLSIILKLTEGELSTLKRLARDDNRTLDNLVETIIKKYVRNNMTAQERLFEDDFIL